MDCHKVLCTYIRCLQRMNHTDKTFPVVSPAGQRFLVIRSLKLWLFFLSLKIYCSTVRQKIHQGPNFCFAKLSVISWLKSLSCHGEDLVVVYGCNHWWSCSHWSFFDRPPSPGQWPSPQSMLLLALVTCGIVYHSCPGLRVFQQHS